MFQHSDSRLTPRGRQGLVERARAGESVSAAAREAGVSRQT
ncbi:MAG: IS481 family transposase, partial [Coriobacteriaceae bacterium]